MTTEKTLSEVLESADKALVDELFGFGIGCYLDQETFDKEVALAKEGELEK